ncbi:MAG TPA: hypothetical protein VLA72_06835 [Anaerolineales bacterium]|nr:hypothetical protein [Anaerolineales bacterium]
MEYTISLALVDFLPVIFTTIGFYFLYKMVAHVDTTQGRVFLVGAILTVIGGFIKATWKLIIASSGTDIRWMDDGMFAWMAPGYLLIVWSIWQTVRNVQGKRIFNAWLTPTVIGVLTLAGSYYLNTSIPESSAWKLTLLSVMVIASVVTSILLLAFAFRQKLTLAGIFFVINLIIIFVMNGLARIPEQTIALQWIEESINTISWFCFAIASKKIFENTQENYGVE